MVRYLDGDYQHVVARVRDGQCVSKYNNMVMSDIFWRITRHVNIPPLATPSPTLRLSSRRASVLHFQSFFFATTSFSRLQEISRASLGVLAAAEFATTPRPPFHPAAYIMVVISRQIHLQDRLCPVSYRGVKCPLPSLRRGLVKWYSV